MAKQRTPNSQDERSNRSAYDKLSGIGVTVACELWRLGAVVRLHHTRKQKLYYLVIAQQVERVFWEHEAVSSNLSSQTYRGQ